MPGIVTAQLDNNLLAYVSGPLIVTPQLPGRLRNHGTGGPGPGFRTVPALFRSRPCLVKVPVLFRRLFRPWAGTEFRSVQPYHPGAVYLLRSQGASCDPLAHPPFRDAEAFGRVFDRYRN